MACKGLPSRKGKTSWIHDVDDKPAPCTVVDEIVWLQSNFPDKALCVHKLEFKADGHNEFRFGYCMCRRGRWWWGQYAPMLPPDDVNAEQHFRRVDGYRHIPALLKALELNASQKEIDAAERVA